MGHIVDNAVDAGSFCFLSGPSENRYTQRYFLQQPLLLPSIAASRKWFRNRGKKKINAEGVAVCGSQWCICRRCRASFPHFSNYSKPPENFVAYFWKKRKSAIVTEPRYFPGRLRRCKIFKHAQLSLIGSYSPFPRRRWGAFSISFFSPKREQPAFIKNKPITAHNSPLLFSGTHFKAVNKKKKPLSKIIVYGSYCW